MSLLSGLIHLATKTCSSRGGEGNRIFGTPSRLRPSGSPTARLPRAAQQIASTPPTLAYEVSCQPAAGPPPVAIPTTLRSPAVLPQPLLSSGVFVQSVLSRAYLAGAKSRESVFGHIPQRRFGSNVCLL